MDTMKSVTKNDTLRITDEVVMDSTVHFLVRLDKCELAFTDTEEKAKLIIDSLASHEQKKLEKDGGIWTKVYREDLKNGRKVVISIQQLGRLYNSYPQRESVFDYVPVGHAILKKGRLELPKPDSVPIPPPVPTPEILEKIALRRSKVTSKPEESDFDSDSDTDSSYLSSSEE